MMSLTGKQKRFLRGLGHSIKSSTMVGKSGLTANTISSANEAFNTRELIKVKIQDGCPIDKNDVAEAIAEATGASIVQILGNTILFFKRDHQKPIIELPD